MDYTTIWITKENRDRLNAIGKRGETFNEIIVRLLERSDILDKIEQKKFYNEQYKILKNEKFVPLRKLNKR